MKLMNRKFWLCVVVIVGGALTNLQAGSPGIQYDLKFDDLGRIIKPDEVFLSRGERSKSKGDWEGAYRSFKTSASYGNAWAKYYVALLYMKDKNFIGALAWLDLLDGDFKEHEKVAYFKGWLEPMMSASDIKAAKDLHSELKLTYGNLAGLVKREKWKKSHQFTGTRIKGHIPIGLRFELANGVFITGTEIREQMDDFVYEYDHQFNTGAVKLNEIEYIESDE